MINLHEKFSTGDTILVRFRLYSDANTNGWGWVIDNLKIQLEPENIQTNIPGDFKLMQNFPNPFNPSTTIRFVIPKKSMVTLKVFDLTGREVATLINEEKNPDKYDVIFNANSVRNGLASRVLFYQLVAGDFVQTKKLSTS